MKMERGHEMRVMRVGGRTQLANNLRQWLSDPRGHWEGDTLVVDTTNFRGGESGGGFSGGLSSSAHVTERFTRANLDTLRYEVTVNDAETYVRPWTAVLLLKQSKDQVYEYACHEGNEAMTGTLGGE